ncbi:MAG: Wzz/FepE/Etk N-terminal domain-containing protein [Thermoanaerobaculia bacterium]
MLSTMERDPFAIPRILWKRKLWVLVFLVLGLAGGILALKSLPPMYEASTMILVEAQKVPEEYVKTTVTSNLSERLRTIQELITNRENLERIVRDLDLYPELRQVAPMEEVVARARRALTISVERGRTFRVTFRGKDRFEVAKAANRIAERFLLENLRVRESQAERTSEFLEVELGEIREQLEEQEEKVSRFRISHEGELPEQRQTNLVAIARLEGELAANREAVENAEIRQLLLESQLRSVGGQGVTPRESGSRLSELRLQLTELKSRFTDRHPDVIRLEREIAELQARSPEPADPKKTAPREEVNFELAAQMDVLEREFERLGSERDQILVEIARLQERLKRTPRVQQELVILTRDYDNLRDGYQDLLSKRLEARLAENLEKRQQSEQFRILERAVPPGRPYSPNKKLCLGLGLLVGLALGVGSAILREETDQTFIDPQSLQSVFPGVVVLASIPEIEGKRRDSSGIPPKVEKTA